MSVELVQFMSQVLNLVMFIQIFTHVKFAEKNAIDSERTFLFLLRLYLLNMYIYSASQKFGHTYSFKGFTLFLLFSTR